MPTTDFPKGVSGHSTEDSLRHNSQKATEMHLAEVEPQGSYGIFAAMEHAPGFLKLVNEQRPLVKEITVEQARQRLKQNPHGLLIDVREDSEWDKGHAAEAIHLGKGVLERDLEKTVPNVDQELIMYCGGGYRSVLTAAVAQKMGYRNVYSVIGGYKALVQAHWPMTSAATA